MPAGRLPVSQSEKAVWRGERILTGNYYVKYKKCYGLSDVNEVASHMRREWDMHIALVKDSIPADRLLVFNIESDSPIALCRFAGLGDAAAKHFGVSNRSDAHAVRYLRRRFPQSLLRAIPAPVKRMTVGMLNKMSR